jgi:hypothetical protein
LWESAALHAAVPHTGPAETEPWIAHELAGVRAGLVRLRASDERLRASRHALNCALLAHDAAQTEHATVTTESAFAIQAGVAAQRSAGDHHASHQRAEAAREMGRRTRARASVTASEAHAQNRNLELQNANEEITDRMMATATDAMPRLQRYVALVNLMRTYDGLDPLPPLPADIPERLVAESCRLLAGLPPAGAAETEAGDETDNQEAIQADAEAEAG